MLRDAFRASWTLGDRGSIVSTAKSKETVCRYCGRSTAVSIGRMETYSSDQESSL